MTDSDFMAAAMAEAQAALSDGEIPVGAVLVRDGKILCRARNRREASHDPTAHAEMICLRRGGELLGDWRLTGCTLYVTLEPCPMCAGAMLMSRISRCVYAASDPALGCCGSVYDLPADPALAGHVRWDQGLMETESRSILKSFFSQARE